MNRTAKLYTYCMIALGLGLLIANFNKSFINIDYRVALLFITIVVLSELISLEATHFSNISFGFSIAFTMIAVLPTYQASMLMFFGFLLSIYKENGKYKHIFNSSMFKRLFNASSYYLTALISGSYFHYVNALDPLKIGNFGIIALSTTVLVYLFINSSIFMGLFALLSQMSIKEMVLKNVWALRSFFTLSPVGIMMLLFYTSYGWFGMMLFLGPLLLARYTFKLYMDMKIVYVETITALTNAIDAKDEYTNGHSRRVAEYSEMLGRKMNLSVQRLEELKTAALLHDVGKIGISDSILLKPGKLDEFEYQMIKNHPMIGANIIDGIEFLEKAKLYVSQHHEFYNGKGYPNGLKGEDMPLESRILSVADAFDAMTTNRSYRKAFSEEKAIAILEEESGKQFSPEVVETMVEIKNEQGRVIVRAC